MRLDNVPVLADLRAALSYHSQRSRVLAANVANADTPGYVPRDMSQSDLGQVVDRSRNAARSADIRATHPLHMTDAGAPAGARTFETQRRPDSETTVDGNAVVLEEQMARVAETRMQYDAAISLYQKSLNLIRMAVKPPGR